MHNPRIRIVIADILIHGLSVVMFIQIMEFTVDISLSYTDLPHYIVMSVHKDSRFTIRIAHTAIYINKFHCS